MRARRFHAANKVYELPGGNEDNALWVQLLLVQDSTLGVRVTTRSVWQFTDEERERIAAGENVSLYVINNGEQPPVLLEVTPARLGKGPYKRWRKDGWPHCPDCGADELYSLTDPAEVETIVGCYACHWKPPE